MHTAHTLPLFVLFIARLVVDLEMCTFLRQANFYGSVFYENYDLPKLISVPKGGEHILLNGEVVDTTAWAQL